MITQGRNLGGRPYPEPVTEKVGTSTLSGSHVTAVRGRVHETDGETPGDMASATRRQQLPAIPTETCHVRGDQR